MLIGHMIVGPGEADRYLAHTLGRACAAVDVMHVSVDPRATEVDVGVVDGYATLWEVLDVTWEDNESIFRQSAWDAMSSSVSPTSSDMVLLVDADELIHNPEAVRGSTLAKAGQALPVTFYEMWSSDSYRVDGLWKPYQAHIIIPWRPGATFLRRRLACGRQPTYVTDVPKFGMPVGEILHYGYATERDRQAKHDRYMRLDGGAFHNIDHLRSILAEPQLHKWEKGGLLDV